MKVYNSSKNSLIAANVKTADNFFSRTIGLLSKKSLSESEGLIIKPCCSIHTFFMRFAIDVIFVDKQNKIIAIYEDVKPWRILPIHLASSYVIELPSGSISINGLQKGDLVKLG